jgi:hypothetical protein
VISLLPYMRHPKEGKLAMSIDGRYQFDRIQPRHWEAESRKSGFTADRSLGHIRDLIARVPDEASSMKQVFKKEGMHVGDLDRLATLLAERCKALATIYGSESMATQELRLPGL